MTKTTQDLVNALVALMERSIAPLELLAEQRSAELKAVALDVRAQATNEINGRYGVLRQAATAALKDGKEEAQKLAAALNECHDVTDEVNAAFDALDDRLCRVSYTRRGFFATWDL